MTGVSQCDSSLLPSSMRSRRGATSRINVRVQDSLSVRARRCSEVSQIWKSQIDWVVLSNSNTTLLKKREIKEQKKALWAFLESPPLKVRTLTVCVVDSGAMPSLLMVSLKVYSTPASSSEPEIPKTGPLEPRPKFRVEQCSGPWQREAGYRFSVKSLTCYFHENTMKRKLKDRKSCCDLKAECVL